MAAVGGKAPDAATVHSDVAQDHDVAASGKLTAGGVERKSNR